MEKNLETVINMFEKYTGSGLHVYLLAGALVFLLFFLKNNKIKVILWVYTLLFVFIYACPFTAGIIIKFFIGRSVYWRMFWVLPSVVITAFAFAYLLERLSYRWMKAVVFCSLCVAIAVTGTFVFAEHNYNEEANRFKLPVEVPTVCHVIDEDAQDIGRVKVVVPNDLLCYIRQYDASFYMPYGRNAMRGENLTKNEQDLFGQMNAQNPDYAFLDSLLNEEGCTHLVWKGDEAYDAPFEALGYRLVNTVDQFRIYRIVPEGGSS